MTQANYFKIGLFMLAGTGLLLSMLLVLGADRLLRDYRIIETYFDGSVEGLEQGAAVTFRGVPVGRVETIAPVAGTYQTDFPYVLVRLAVESAAFDGRQRSDGFLLEQSAKGLRLRLNFRGVTGTALLEADYLDAERFPPLELDWIPEHPYIPSAPSAMQLLTASADRLMTGLQGLDLRQMAVTLERTLIATSATLEGIDSRRLTSEAADLLAELRQTNRQMAELLREGTASASGLHRLTEEARAPLGRLLTAAAAAAQSLERLTADVEESGDLSASLNRLRRLVDRLDGLVSENQEDIAATVDNLHIFSGQLREISEEARRHPSRLLFGEPPPPLEPGR